MSKGGSTCNQLKFIRKRLAEQNGIDYKVERCPNSDNCKEGTCPFCEKEADDLMAVLLEKEKRGEKVIWDVSLDEYDPSTLYGDGIELNGNEVVIHGDAKFGEVTIPPIDTDPITLEEIKLRPTRMGVVKDVMKIPDIVKKRQVDGMVDIPPFVNSDKEFEFPDFKTVDAPWFDIDKEKGFYNENHDSSISLEKPLFAEVLPGTEYSTPFCKPLMGDVVMPEEKSENAESRTIHDETVESKDVPITVEAIKAVRRATFEEMMYCKRMLQKYGGDVDKAIEEINNHPSKRPLMGRVMMDDET